MCVSRLRNKWTTMAKTKPMPLAQHRRTLGENIRAQRKLAGWSQEKLAEKADLHPVYVGSIERGQENVSIDSLNRIARALKSSVGELVSGF
jgi:transcriptional regulator with XRE-family HTH domain